MDRFISLRVSTRFDVLITHFGLTHYVTHFTFERPFQNAAMYFLEMPSWVSFITKDSWTFWACKGQSMCSLMVCHNTLSFTAIFTFITFIWFSHRETHTCVIVNNQTLQMPDHILDIWTSFLTMFYFEMIFKTGFIRKISTTFITWNFWTVCWVYMINQNMWL